MRIKYERNETRQKESMLFEKRPKNSLSSIFFVRVGINGFLRNTIHYTRGSLPEERKTLARTHEGGLLNRWRTKEFEAITHETLSPDRIREEHGVCVFDVNDSMLTYSTDARFDVKAKFSFLSRWP